jgi:hypothetical protein
MSEAAEVIEPTISSNEQEVSSNEPEKTFVQGEVDKIVTERVGREKRKYEKKYEGIDIDQFHKWQENEAQSVVDKATEKGEFQKVLKLQAEKKDGEIARLSKLVTNNKIDGALLRAAELGQAIAPSQVVELLKGKVRLNSEAVAEVVDVDGTTRYGDDGSLLTPEQLVGEFLTTSPHFVKASLGGAGSAGSVGGNTSRLKSVGDMSTAEYAEHRSKIGRGRNTGGYIKPN